MSHPDFAPGSTISKLLGRKHPFRPQRANAQLDGAARFERSQLSVGKAAVTAQTLFVRYFWMFSRIRFCVSAAVGMKRNIRPPRAPS